MGFSTLLLTLQTVHATDASQPKPRVKLLKKYYAALDKDDTEEIAFYDHYLSKFPMTEEEDKIMDDMYAEEESRQEEQFRQEEQEYLLRQHHKRQKEQQRARKAAKALRDLKKRRNSKSHAPKKKQVRNPQGCPTCGSPYRGERLWVKRSGQQCEDDFHALAVGLLAEGYYSEDPEQICYAYER